MACIIEASQGLDGEDTRASATATAATWLMGVGRAVVIDGHLVQDARVRAARADAPACSLTEMVDGAGPFSSSYFWVICAHDHLILLDLMLDHERADRLAELLRLTIFSGCGNVEHQTCGRPIIAAHGRSGGIHHRQLVRQHTAEKVRVW